MQVDHRQRPLATVVGARIVMEQAATALGRRYAVADITTGALVLAVVTLARVHNQISAESVTAGYRMLRGLRRTRSHCW